LRLAWRFDHDRIELDRRSGRRRLRKTCADSGGQHQCCGRSTQAACRNDTRPAPCNNFHFLDARARHHFIPPKALRLILWNRSNRRVCSQRSSDLDLDDKSPIAIVGKILTGRCALFDAAQTTAPPRPYLERFQICLRHLIGTIDQALASQHFTKSGPLDS
jgi:hypothetical protein